MEQNKKFSLQDYLLDMGIDPELADKVGKACAFHFQPYKCSKYTDQGKVVAQIFEKGVVGFEDLMQVFDMFPGLVIEPVIVRRQIHENGPMPVADFIGKLRLSVG